MTTLREKLDARRATFDTIIANKKPSTLEHLINTVEMPEHVRESLMRDYNQMYYNMKKPHKTTNTEIANNILFNSIVIRLRSWKKRQEPPPVKWVKR